jgi:hypothetical protein
MSVDTTGQTEALSSACMAPRSTRSNSRPSNGPQFVHLVASWLASIPEVDARLPADPSASPTSPVGIEHDFWRFYRLTS